MQPILAVARVAARAGLALIASAGDVVKISTTRPLQQIAADGRGIAKLRRSPGQQRFGDGWIARCEIGIVRQIGIADERTDTEAAVSQAFDAIEPGQPRDVDQTAWARNAAFIKSSKLVPDAR